MAYTLPNRGSLAGLKSQHVDVLRAAVRLPRFTVNDVGGEVARDAVRNLEARCLVRAVGRVPTMGSPKVYVVSDCGRLVLATQELRAVAA